MIQPVIFLLDAVIGFFTLLLLLRFFMQLNRVSFANQIGSFVVQATNWAVKPLRRVLPGVLGLDLASLVPAWLLQCLLLAAIYALRSSGAIDPGALLLLVLWQGLVATLRVAIWVFIGALFLQAVLSWVNPFSPLGQPVAQLTRPLLQPIQRFVPPIANIDLSPLVAIVLLQVVLMLL
ncbi:MAG: YggT family protein [Rhodocyclales bacterium]|nr:YggT family protein [Rhodocyclales bacterium]